jgi:hypothetical protein
MAPTRPSISAGSVTGFLSCLISGLAPGLVAVLVGLPLPSPAADAPSLIQKRQGLVARQVGAIQNAVAASIGVAPVSPSDSAASGQLTLVRTDRLLPLSGDPVWELQLDLPGQPRRAYEALVGRAARQLADRDLLGSRAPLPQGRYLLSPSTPVQIGDSGELGRFFWIALEPQFPTARRGLGIHHDPSAGWGRQSGTDGCIGLIHGNDLLGLAALLERSGTRELLVRD